jgi:hypothetical protein
MERLPSRRRVLLALGLSLPLLAPPVAIGHFALRAPASWREQDFLGNPQKTGPCGDEGTAATTGTVTPFAPGETITITLDETIFHPGHYRVSLAVLDRSELPAEPPVTPGDTPCGTGPIMAPPVFPVLADGALLHTDPFANSQSIQVTLPSDVTCTHCTLQVLEFMSNHSAPCFYHHCADISIVATGETCGDDDECADTSVCTTDRCNLDTGRCEHPDTVTPTCDDADACTQDACDAAQGCSNRPLTLADVGETFLGALPLSDCSTDHLPRAVGLRFERADALVARAAEKPTHAKRLLTRASKKLRKAGRRVTTKRRRPISPGCRAAVGSVLDQARARVQCLLVSFD